MCGCVSVGVWVCGCVCARAKPLNFPQFEWPEALKDMIAEGMLMVSVSCDCHMTCAVCR